MQGDDHYPKNHPSSEAISGEVVRTGIPRAGTKLLLLAWKNCHIGDGLTQDLGLSISGGVSWDDFRVQPFRDCS